MTSDKAEVSVPVAAAPEIVFEYLVHGAGSSLLDEVLPARGGGRAMVMVGPDAQGATMVTIVLEGHADRDDLASRMHTGLGPLSGELTSDGRVPDGDDIGLDAIKRDLAGEGSDTHLG